MCYHFFVNENKFPFKSKTISFGKPKHVNRVFCLLLSIIRKRIRLANQDVIYTLMIINIKLKWHIFITSIIILLVMKCFT